MLYPERYSIIDEVKVENIEVNHRRVGVIGIAYIPLVIQRLCRNVRMVIAILKPNY